MITFISYNGTNIMDRRRRTCITTIKFYTMKRIIYLSLLLTFLISCEINSDPQKSEACFGYSPQTGLTTATEITFTNCSQHAISYIWSFGDGTSSTEKEPAHRYANSGTYRVLLMAQNDELMDVNADGVLNWMDGTITRDTISALLSIAAN